MIPQVWASPRLTSLNLRDEELAHPTGLMLAHPSHRLESHCNHRLIPVLRLFHESLQILRGMIDPFWPASLPWLHLVAPVEQPFLLHGPKPSQRRRPGDAQLMDRLLEHSAICPGHNNSHLGDYEAVDHGVWFGRQIGRSRGNASIHILVKLSQVMQ